MTAIAAIGPARAGAIAVRDGYARATIALVKTGAVYLRIENSGAADRLRGAASPAAERAELHMHRNENGVMSMTQVKCIAIPAGGAVAFAPGSLHVMLFGLKAPLVEGAETSLTLVFDHAGEVNVRVPVRGVAAGSEGGGGHSHEPDICD